MRGWSKVSSGRGIMFSLRMTFCEARLSGVVMATTSRRVVSLRRWVRRARAPSVARPRSVGVRGETPADFYGGLREVGDFEAHGLGAEDADEFVRWCGLRGRTW